MLYWGQTELWNCEITFQLLDQHDSVRRERSWILSILWSPPWNCTFNSPFPHFSCFLAASFRVLTGAGWNSQRSRRAAIWEVPACWEVPRQPSMRRAGGDWSINHLVFCKPWGSWLQRWRSVADTPLAVTDSILQALAWLDFQLNTYSASPVVGSRGGSRVPTEPFWRGREERRGVAAASGPGPCRRLSRLLTCVIWLYRLPLF